jgi:hypothetical protein
LLLPFLFKDFDVRKLGISAISHSGTR